MALLAPRVMVPLSECSSMVWVQSQLSGSTVRVYANGTKVVDAVAFSANQLFGLLSGASLPAGAMVTATQTVGTETSPASPDPVQVQAQPPTIGPVGYPAVLHECGECTWLDGLVPGADVEVRVQGGPSLGTSTGHTGSAWVPLSPPIPPGSVIEARQTACGTPGSWTDAPPLEGLQERKVIPRPTVKAPLRECQRSVVVQDVLPGAMVTLLRSAGPNQVRCCAGTSVQFGVTPPLALGETISARQEFPACNVTSPDATPVVVGPAEPVPSPGVKAPLCEGSTTVTLTGLVDGSRVRIQQDGVDLGEAEAPNDGEFDFNVPPLTGGSLITATQELCGKWSAPGAAVMVDAAPGSLPTPVIPPPLFECAGVVHVESLHPGTRVYVYSEALGAPIGDRMSYDTEANVTVAPLLIAGDKIYATQKGCGTVSSESARVTVQSIPEFRAPTVVEPLYSCATGVPVEDVVPGARVDVFVNGIWRGTATAGSTEVTVGIYGELEVGDQVRARQRLCDKVSGLSNVVIVEEFQGRWYQVGSDTFAEILAVHAALMPTGRIVYFGGDQHTVSLNQSGDVDHTRVFDCASRTISPVTGLPATADIFCAGHVLLADGKLLVGGGTRNWGGGGPHPSGHFIGSRESWTFDPSSETWNPTAGKLVTQRASEVASGVDIQKTGGRWYPTLVALPNGRVLAISGHPEVEDTRHNNNSLELFDPASGTWSIVGSTDYSNIERNTARGYEYPRMFVLPDGSVLSASTMDDGNLERWHPYTDATDWDFVIGPAPESFYGGFAQDSTAVLLPLRHETKYTARVLLAGGQTPYMLEPLASSPSWISTSRTMTDYPASGDVNPRRENSQSTLLPTGEVIVTGGLKNPSDEGTTIKRAEMFDPEAGPSGTWRVLPEAGKSRNYHSVALLMPNGAVWVAGSNFGANPGLNNRELSIEIFEPWYFCGPRPRITDAPAEACHGEEFEIRTPDADAVTRVVLIRAGSVTHNFSPDQRYLSIPFRHAGGDLIVATVPDEAAVAIPGYYVLFILGAQRVPSEGRFIRICPSPGPTRPWPWDEDWWRRLIELLREWLRGQRSLDEILELLRRFPPRPWPPPPRRPIRRLQRPVPLHDHGHPIHGGHGDDGHDHGPPPEEQA